MTREEAINHLKTVAKSAIDSGYDGAVVDAVGMAIEALEQEPCEMTAEEYRQRMVQAFHNADTDELIAVCVLPTEKEFEHLEWLLKNHYKKEPCEDAISREAVLDALHVSGRPTKRFDYVIEVRRDIEALPPVTPQPKTGHWSRKTKVDAYDIAGVKTWGIKCQCDRCDFTTIVVEDFGYYKYCPNCGAKMAESEVRNADSN